MAIFVPDQARADFLSAVHNLTTGTYKGMLVGTGYTPAGGDTFVSTAAAFEVTGTGYTGGFAGAGRKTLTTLAITVDGTNHLAYWSWDALTWTSVTIGTARYLVIWKPNSTDANSKQIMTIQFDNDQITTGGNLTYTPPAAGVLQL